MKISSQIQRFKEAAREVGAKIKHWDAGQRDWQAQMVLLDGSVTFPVDFWQWWQTYKPHLGTDNDTTLRMAWDRLNHNYFLDSRQSAEIVELIYTHPRCPLEIKDKVATDPWRAISRKGAQHKEARRFFLVFPREVWEKYNKWPEMFTNLIDRAEISEEIILALWKMRNLSEFHLVTLWRRSVNFPRANRRLAHSLPAEWLVEIQDVENSMPTDRVAARILFRKGSRFVVRANERPYYQKRFGEKRLVFLWAQALKQKDKPFVKEMFEVALKEYPEVLAEVWKKATPSHELFSDAEVKEMLSKGLMAKDREFRELLAVWLGKRGIKETKRRDV